MHCKDFLPLRVIGKVGNYVYDDDGNDDDDYVADFPAVFFHICGFDICHETTDKYKYKYKYKYNEDYNSNVNTTWTVPRQIWFGIISTKNLD